MLAYNTLLARMLGVEFRPGQSEMLIISLLTALHEVLVSLQRQTKKPCRQLLPAGLVVI
jgi:hypothetical protein